MCTDGRRCENCPAKRLSAGAKAMAHALPALGTVVAVTANDAALLSHTGESHPHLLAHLVDMDLPFTVAVPGGGCVQLHRGRAAMFDSAGTRFAVVFGACRYALDPVYVAECWVTQAQSASGLTSAVEPYDHSNRCVTVITQTGPICEQLHDGWESIVASLPGCEG